MKTGAKPTRRPHTDDLSIRTQAPPAGDPQAPIRLLIIDGQGLPRRLDWQPEAQWEHLSTVWGLMMVLIQGRYAEGLRFTSWKTSSAAGKTMKTGSCGLLGRLEQGPSMGAGETVTFTTAPAEGPRGADA